MGLDSRADFKPDGIVIGDYEITSLSGCQPSDCGYICVSNIEDIGIASAGSPITTFDASAGFGSLAIQNP